MPRLFSCNISQQFHCITVRLERARREEEESKLFSSIFPFSVYIFFLGSLPLVDVSYASHALSLISSVSNMVQTCKRVRHTRPWCKSVIIISVVIFNYILQHTFHGNYFQDCHRATALCGYKGTRVNCFQCCSCSNGTCTPELERFVPLIRVIQKGEQEKLFDYYKDTCMLTILDAEDCDHRNHYHPFLCVLFAQPTSKGPSAIIKKLLFCVPYLRILVAALCLFVSEYSTR